MMTDTKKELLKAINLITGHINYDEEFDYFWDQFTSTSTRGLGPVTIDTILFNYGYDIKSIRMVLAPEVYDRTQIKIEWRRAK